MSTIIGASTKRVDALEKVTGKARYTDDFLLGDCLYGKILHSTIANGIVKKIDIEDAAKLPGVVKIITCFDVPDIQFPTAGHPYSLDSSHGDVADRKLLNQRVRFYGDDIAVVVAETELQAEKALKSIRVEYEEYNPILTVEQAMEEGKKQGNIPIHEEYPNNVLAHTSYNLGNFDEAIKEEGLQIFEGTYHVPMVQHCHIENPISYAYQEAGKIVVVSSTQIPHIVRRVISQALKKPYGEIRVIKPYIGGGFGNKQEVLYEPLNAYLSLAVGGRCVKLDISREETFVNTRVRHAMKIHIKSYVRPDGRFVAREAEIISNQGGYASHGHSIAANASNAFRHIYQDEGGVRAQVYTVYTNLPSGGAMRGYGIPQITFALEAHVDEIAKNLGIDPTEIRQKNCMKQGWVDPLLGIQCNSCGLQECIDKGKDFIQWEEKQQQYKNQSGKLRRGVGMSIFSYKTGVYPISLETASSRLVMNQDGSVQLQMGATEIGQGADTVFGQMAAESIGIPFEMVHVISTQDTDITPFDTGAYASRQSYVSGMAVKKAALLLKRRVLEYASWMLKLPESNLDLQEGKIICRENGETLLGIDEVALSAFYSTDRSEHLTAEASHQCKSNTFSFGACFAEVEVDIPLGKVKILKIINVHDSGKILNPALAAAQVHGGMMMGIGYGLSEQMLFDSKTGRPLNNNLLDYKFPTTMDIPDLEVQFAETYDLSGPYGNKSLGEPPAISPAPAIRNAIYAATGIPVNDAPMTPQKLHTLFQENGLTGMEKEGNENV